MVHMDEWTLASRVIAPEHREAGVIPSCDAAQERPDSFNAFSDVLFHAPGGKMGVKFNIHEM
jgi:hypothetical protein